MLELNITNYRDVILICQVFLSSWPDAYRGPAHKLFEGCYGDSRDFNDGNIEICLREIDDWKHGVDDEYLDPPHAPEEVDATEVFLRALLAVPLEVRLFGGRVNVNATISLELADRLDQQCARMKRSRASIAETAIEDWIDNRESLIDKAAQHGGD